MGRRGPIGSPNGGRAIARRKKMAPVDHPDVAPDPPADLGPRGLLAWEECWALPWVQGSDRMAIESLARLVDRIEEMYAHINEDRMRAATPLTSAANTTTRASSGPRGRNVDESHMALEAQEARSRVRPMGPRRSDRR